LVGVQGPEYAIDRKAAVRLVTVAGAPLSDETDCLGPLANGRLADLVAFRADPMTCDLDQLPELKPVITIVGGRAVFDPEGLFASLDRPGPSPAARQRLDAVRESTSR
jgi:predicted amidohydrolase YtcJ